MLSKKLLSFGIKTEYNKKSIVETVNKQGKLRFFSRVYHSVISIRHIELAGFSTILRPYYYYY